MALYLGILIFSFIVTSLATVPFINLLYKLKLTYHKPISALAPQENKEFKIINKQTKWKIGTPIGGGVLIITMVIFLYSVLYLSLTHFGIAITTVFPLKEEINLLFFTFTSFALLGLYDDIIKIFNIKQSQKYSYSWPGRKSILILGLSFFVASIMHLNLDISIINIPIIGVVNFGFIYIPIATLIIASFSKAFDITDGMDGLASGVFLICLIAFWGISLAALDTVISIFIALIIGSLIAFMYFNIYPARIWLGNAGSLSFGATLAVIGLLLGKTFALLIVGSVFLIEAMSQVIQIISLKFRGKKVFSVTPLHYWLQSLGWVEPKVVTRLWLTSIVVALVGLWFATT